MKKAYSIVELLICLTFMAVLTLYGVHILNDKFQDYGAQYYNAFKVLRKVSYNVLADTHCRQDTENPDTDCRGAADSGGSDNARPFPENSKDLCLRFLDYINSPIPKSEWDSACSETDLSGATKNINLQANNLTEDNVRFVASNGFKFWFSDKQTITDDGCGGPDGVCRNTDKQNLNFFIVFVDLNGTRKPNKLNYDEDFDTLPDIVPFAVTELGDAIPMGYPAYTDKYMTVRVKFPYTDIDPSTGKVKPAVKVANYSTGVFNAFGWKQYTDMPQTLHFTQYVISKVGGRNNSLITKEPRPSQPMYSMKINGYDTGAGATPGITPGFSAHKCARGVYACVVSVDQYSDRRF